MRVLEYIGVICARCGAEGVVGQEDLEIELDALPTIRNVGRAYDLLRCAEEACQSEDFVVRDDHDGVLFEPDALIRCREAMCRAPIPAARLKAQPRAGVCIPCGEEGPPPLLDPEVPHDKRSCPKCLMPTHAVQWPGGEWSLRCRNYVFTPWRTTTLEGSCDYILKRWPGPEPVAERAPVPVAERPLPAIAHDQLMPAVYREEVLAGSRTNPEAPVRLELRKELRGSLTAPEGEVTPIASHEAAPAETDDPERDAVESRGQLNELLEEWSRLQGPYREMTHRIDELKDQIRGLVMPGTRVELETHRFYAGVALERVVIEDETRLPEEFWKQVPDRQQIKAVWKEQGEVPPGVSIQAAAQSLYLRSKGN